MFVYFNGNILICKENGFLFFLKNGACVLGTPYFFVLLFFFSKCHLRKKVKVHSAGKNFRAFSLFFKGNAKQLNFTCLVHFCS